MRSRVATACARLRGWRSSGSKTAVARCTWAVAAAMALRSVSGSARGRASSESPAQTESKPARSAALAMSIRMVTSPSAHSTVSCNGSNSPIRGVAMAMVYRLAGW